jgi:hypothetical protein
MAWRTCATVLVSIVPLQENAADKNGGAPSPQVVTLPKKTRVSLPLNPSYGLFFCGANFTAIYHP